MTAAIPMRTEAQLLRLLAQDMRVHRRRDFSDALHQVMHGESHDRWINLVAALSVDLGIEPINSYDVDQLHVGDGRPDHPAAYATRLDIWCARINDPSLVAVTLDQLADREDAELTAATRSLSGGRELVTP